MSSHTEAQARLRQHYLAMLRRSGEDLTFADHRPASFSDVLERGRLNRQTLEQMIRMLEDDRGYGSFETVGTEPLFDYLYRLATVRQRKGPYLGDRLPQLQRVLDNQAAEVFRWLDALDLDLPSTVFVGVFPTGQLNARSHVVPDSGVLVLVNAGLMDLIFTVLKTNLATASIKSWGPPLLQREQASMVLTDALNAYLFAGNSFHSWALPRLPKEREPFLEYVLRRAEQFVLCHELGHIFAGHVRVERKDSPTRRPNPEDEFEADRIALSIMTKAAVPGRDSARHGQYLAAGIFAFFVVAKAVEWLQSELGLPISDRNTHPALLDRMNTAEPYLESTLPGPDPIRRAALFAGWMGGHLTGIRDRLGQVDGALRRPGRWEKGS
jgi:hypothetical protein